MNPNNLEQPDRSNDYVMYVVVNDQLGQKPGKFSSQTGHAVEKITSVAMALLFGHIEEIYDLFRNDVRLLEFARLAERETLAYEEYSKSPTKIVLGANKEEWEELKKLTCIIVVDEGRTEVPPNSETVLGFWPMRKSDAPEIIKNLNLKRWTCSDCLKI